MSTLFVGIGNEFRQDDSLGLWLVRQLKSSLKVSNAHFNEASGEGLSLMDMWQGHDTVVMFDAVMAQGNPGRIIHLQASRDHLPSDFFKYSSHAFSLAEAVELSRVMGLLPATMHVFGVEGEQFGYGQNLSDAVLKSCKKLIEGPPDWRDLIHSDSSHNNTKEKML